MLVENLNLFLLLNYKIKIVLGAPDMPFMTFSSINNYSFLKQCKYLYPYQKRNHSKFSDNSESIYVSTYIWWGTERIVNVWMYGWINGFIHQWLHTERGIVRRNTLIKLNTTKQGSVYKKIMLSSINMFIINSNTSSIMCSYSEHI